MSSAITRKSSDDPKSQLGGAGLLLGAGGSLAPVGPLLLDWQPQVPVASHGLLPEPLPPAPQGLSDQGPATVLQVTGPERESWLQGVQTADLRALPVDGGGPSYFLNGRGRTLCAGLLVRGEKALRVAVPADRLAPLRAHLDKLLIMEDAELSEAQGLWRLRWAPGGAQAPLRQTLPAALVERLEGVRGVPGPLGFDLLLPEEEARALLAQVAERPDPQAEELFRVALGVPLFGTDFDEETTPLEAGLDAHLSFDKGCYVGQEVIAMATFRGRVPFALVRLEVAGPPPARGSAIDPSRPGKGRVTSAQAFGDRSLLLGTVHRDLIVPGGTVPLADGRPARVLGLPAGSRPGAGQAG